MKRRNFIGGMIAGITALIFPKFAKGEKTVGGLPYTSLSPKEKCSDPYCYMDGTKAEVGDMVFGPVNVKINNVMERKWIVGSVSEIFLDRKLAGGCTCSIGALDQDDNGRAIGFFEDSCYNLNEFNLVVPRGCNLLKAKDYAYNLHKYKIFQAEYR